MGLFGGSNTTTTNEKFDSGPSSFQRPYLDQTFSGAQGAYNSQKGTPYFQGDTYAGMTEEGRKALEAMRGFASNQGLGAATTLSNIGSSLAGYGTQAGTALDNYAGSFGEDGQRALMDSAGRYADNPHLSGQIDAVTRDVSRNLSEDILPSIDRAASAGGNINSSRAGIASGIAQRGAADRVADVSSQMRGDAYNRGLDMARSDRDGQLNLANAYRGLSQTGMDALQAGAETGYGAFDRINAGNALDQADRQGQLDDDFQKWQGQDTREWDLLGRYNDIVGSSQWGQSGTSNGTSVQKQKSSILGSILGAAGVAASFIPSDRRLKTDIRRIGETDDGLGVFSYRYKGTDAPQVGVMAQEVAKKKPSALGPKVKGYLTVNYDKL